MGTGGEVDAPLGARMSASWVAEYGGWAGRLADFSKVFTLASEVRGLLRAPVGKDGLWIEIRPATTCSWTWTRTPRARKAPLG